MESILLACAILVCISGVMFVSGELYKEGNEIPQALATFFLTLIVLGSFLYIGVVFASELRVKIPPCLMRLFADAKTALEKQNEAKGGTYGDDDDDVELNANPLIKSEEDKARIQAAKDQAEEQKLIAIQAQEEAARLGLQSDAMMLNMRSLKKQAMGGGVRKRVKKKKKGGKKKKRMDFSSKNGIEMSMEEEGIEMSKMNELMLPSIDGADQSKKGSSGGDTPKREGKMRGKSKKGRSSSKKNKSKKTPSSRSLHANIVDPSDHGMDIFETTDGTGFVNPLKSGVGLNVQNDAQEHTYLDAPSGRRYSINHQTGESKWLDDDDNEDLALL
jgi:hypothetical protein